MYIPGKSPRMIVDDVVIATVFVSVFNGVLVIFGFLLPISVTVVWDISLI